jgi:lipopolysaccharide heptosyltransferase II
MSRQSQASSPPRRILVRGVNWLGDAVLTTPALLRLREHFPDALIALLTPEKLRGLWLHHPAVDEIIPVKPGDSVWTVASKIRILMWPVAERKPGRAEPGPGPPEADRRGSEESGAGVSSPAGRPEAAAFDLAVVLPNSPRSALEVWLARVPRRVGYARPWRNFLLTTRVPPPAGSGKMRKRSVAEIRGLVGIAGVPRIPHAAQPAPVHQVHDYLQLVSVLGANPEPVPSQLVVTPGELKGVEKKFNLGSGFTSDRPLFGLNPGAEYGPAKRWPAERFIAAAAEIQKRTGCLWLLFGGKGKADKTLAGRIEAGLGSAHCELRNLAGQTSLRELCALLKLCRVLLTNDTGPMHVAAALGTPVVVPFGSTSPELTGPGFAGGPRHQLLRANAPCSPCFRRTCPIDFRCMTGITVEQVVAAVLQAVA